MADLTDTMADAIVGALLLARLAANGGRLVTGGQRQPTVPKGPNYVDTTPKTEAVFRLPRGTRTATDTLKQGSANAAERRMQDGPDEERRLNSYRDPFVDDFGE